MEEANASGGGLVNLAQGEYLSQRHEAGKIPVRRLNPPRASGGERGKSFIIKIKLFSLRTEEVKTYGKKNKFKT